MTGLMPSYGDRIAGRGCIRNTDLTPLAPFSWGKGVRIQEKTSETHPPSPLGNRVGGLGLLADPPTGSQHCDAIDTIRRDFSVFGRPGARPTAGRPNSG